MAKSNKEPNDAPNKTPTQGPNRVGFGSGSKRFGRVTLHPKLDESGAYKQTTDPGLDPSRYSPIPMHEVYRLNKRVKNKKDPWRCKAELEQWSLNLGYRNQSVLDARRWQKSLLGPAWTEIPTEKKCESACKNVGFGRNPRFPSKKLFSVPGPGTYYKHVPFKAPYGPHSSRPSFERDDPCRFRDRTPSWIIAPNRYNVLDLESIDELSRKVTSIRGPYDLFTGRRDGTTIKNHFNTTKCLAATWPLSFPGSLEELKKKHYGVFNKTNREVPYRGRNALVDPSLCVRYAQEPGPAHYDVLPRREFRQHMYGFNSSYDKPRMYEKTVVWPAVGRYKVKHLTCGILGHGWRSVFKSKVQRTIGDFIPKPMNSF